MSTRKEEGFLRYIRERYEGKVHKIERVSNPMWEGLEVHVMFRFPEHEADELEVYKRIISVIDVIAEG